MPLAEVNVSRRVNVDPGLVWNTIAAGDGLDKWLPVITQCRLEGSGAGATRYCTMANGAQLKERILEVDHARRVFRYSIDEHPLPARNLTGRVEIRDQGDGTASVSWGARFEVEPPYRSELEEMFRGVYEQAIRGLEAFLVKA
jgi:uncharacterized protein YndB with AHSA1/START domain